VKLPPIPVLALDPPPIPVVALDSPVVVLDPLPIPVVPLPVPVTPVGVPVVVSPVEGPADLVRPSLPSRQATPASAKHPRIAVVKGLICVSMATAAKVLSRNHLSA
jgi:hypothetical protein